MEKDFCKFGVPPQPKRVQMFFDERELDLLLQSVKTLYSHFFVDKEFSNSPNRELVYGLTLSELKDLYSKIRNAY